MINKLINDPSVHEILIAAWNDVHYSQKGEIKAAKLFKTEASYKTFVNGLIKQSKLPAGKTNYYFSLDDYTKVNIVLPPVSLKGPSINILKIPMQDISLDDLEKWEALDTKSKTIIQDALNNNSNILVAGNLGSGKTTLLNSLIKGLPEPMRVVTLERHADLIVKKPMCTRLNARSETEMLEMIEMAENMRADYIVLAEARGSEVMPFIDFVRNNCSSLACISAQDALDAIKRLETKALISSAGMSLEDVRYAISQAFHIIIFQERLPDGKRKVTNISAIEYQSGELKLKNLYK